jgi:hypothetical protein
VGGLHWTKLRIQTIGVETITDNIITVGTRVAFSREFLRNTGQFAGLVPFARGQVTALNALSPGFVLAAVQWDNIKSASNVNVANLVREDRIHLEPA